MIYDLRECGLSDLPSLVHIAYETYNETFRSLNTDEIMNAYLSSAFHPNQLKAEVSNPSCKFFLLYAGELLAGYLKLNDFPAQTDLNDPESLEIERIYLAKSFQGQGLGRLLLQKAIEVAQALNKSYIWLGVWEKNIQGIAFYKKMGFTEFGMHEFNMGGEIQHDYIMRKDLIMTAALC